MKLKLQTATPKRLSVSDVGVKWILQTNSWHPSKWQNPRDGSATHIYLCWAPPLRFMLCVTVWCRTRQTFTYELVETTCGSPSVAGRLSPLNKLPHQRPPEDQVQARKAHQSRRNFPEVLHQGKSTVTLREALRFRPLTVNIYTFGLRFGEASFGVQLAHQFLPTYRGKKKQQLSAQEQQQTDE